MDEKWIAFCEGILEGKSARQAYDEAGFDVSSPQAATNGAARLMGEPEVILYLAMRRAEIQETTGVTSERITAEIAAIAFLDVGEIVVEDIRGPEDLAKLPERVRRAVTGWKWDRMGNFVVKFANKQKALDQLAKIHGLYQKDKENEADAAANLLKTAFWRYVTSLKVSEGLSLAEAVNYARNNPEIVEAWGRKAGLITGETSDEIVVDP